MKNPWGLQNNRVSYILFQTFSALVVPSPIYFSALFILPTWLSFLIAWFTERTKLGPYLWLRTSLGLGFWLTFSAPDMLSFQWSEPQTQSESFWWLPQPLLHYCMSGRILLSRLMLQYTGFTLGSTVDARYHLVFCIVPLSLWKAANREDAWSIVLASSKGMWCLQQ